MTKLKRPLFAIAVLLILAWQMLAANTPIAPCGAGADVVIASGSVWTNPGNACTSGQFAINHVAAANGFSDYLAVTTFGFSVPVSATILGVTATVTRFSPGGTSIVDNGVFLTKNGTVAVGLDHSTGNLWPNLAAAQVYGGSTDLWGTTLSVAQVNASSFGLLISATNENATFSRTAEVNAFVTITVTYSGQSKGSSPGFVGTLTMMRSVGQ